MRIVWWGLALLWGCTTDPRVDERLAGREERKDSKLAIGLLGERSQHFREETAMLVVPRGADVAKHLRQARLRAIEPRRASQRILAPGVQRGLPQRRRPPRNRSSNPIRVALDLAGAQLSDLDQYLKQRAERRSLRVSSEPALRTLAAIAGHRLKFERLGFVLGLDLPRRAMQQASMLDRTQEDPAAYGGTGDALQDQHWRWTHLDHAWRLVQVAERREDVVWLAVHDVGFTHDHEDFEPDGQVSFPGDVGENHGSNWHGTQVAATAVATVNDGEGAAGSSLLASPTGLIRPLVVGGSTGLIFVDQDRPMDLMDMSEDAELIRGAIDIGADIINTSWGYVFDQSWGAFYCDGLDDALMEARDAGVVVIAAAGNDGDKLSEWIVEPCEAVNEGRLAVCVGGVDAGGQNLFNFGEPVDVWAPGEEIQIGSTPDSPGLNDFGGTSGAAPFVAGVVALRMALGDSPSVSEVRAALRDSSQPGTDGDAPRLLDAFRFLHDVSRVIEDPREPNNDLLGEGTLFYGDHLVPGELLTLANSALGNEVADLDVLPVDDVPECGTISLTLGFVHPDDAAHVEVRIGGPIVAPITVNERTRRYDAVRVEPEVYPAGRALVHVRSIDGWRTGYSIEGLTVGPGSGAIEDAAHPATCNAIDDDCDGLVDEGFPDTDHDGMADCVDDDDDADCVLDTADNCRTAPNGNQFCSGADADEADGGCGVDCPIPQSPLRELGGLLLSCTTATAAPACFDDGCPWNEAFREPGVAGLVGAVELATPRTPGPGIQGVEVLPGGRVRLRGSPELGGDIDVARLRCHQLIGLGRKTIQRTMTSCEEEHADDDCQRDKDGDGLGDACDP